MLGAGGWGTPAPLPWEQQPRATVALSPPTRTSLLGARTVSLRRGATVRGGVGSSQRRAARGGCFGKRWPLCAGSAGQGSRVSVGWVMGAVTCSPGTWGSLDLGQVVKLWLKWSRNPGLSLVGRTVRGDCAEGHVAGTAPSWVGVSGLDPGWDGASEGKVAEGDCGWLFPQSCAFSVGQGGRVGAGPLWHHCSWRVEGSTGIVLRRRV